MADIVLTFVILPLLVAFVVFIVWRHHRVRSENDDLLVNGTPATATIERIVPELGEDDLFVVTVRLDEGHVIEARWFLSSLVLPAVQPGRSVAVRLDAERRRAAFDARAMGYG